MIKNSIWPIDGLVVFYGISTFVGYLSQILFILIKILQVIKLVGVFT